ncbi:PIN domain-containing protein [Ruegeria intermedia]|uniref:type II toxin-antitoxin system VapC family toxin n=1 Tax=Ruegeria intermedia TaxID=996115 RepID=UPI00122C6D5E|nr:type II toxin-antitoxin system VapC family toxin [Ruegeria intermedia]
MFVPCRRPGCGAAFRFDGKRRSRVIAGDVAGRVLPFGCAAAVALTAIFVDPCNAGRPISFADCQVAAAARVHGAAIATRKVVDFEGRGIEVIDPWTTGGGT